MYRAMVYEIAIKKDKIRDCYCYIIITKRGGILLKKTTFFIINYLSICNTMVKIEKLYDK